MASQTTSLASKLDLVGAVIAIVMGLLLVLGIMSLEMVVGVILLVIGIIALAKSV